MCDMVTVGLTVSEKVRDKQTNKPTNRHERKYYSRRATIIIHHLMLISGNYSITAEKTITGGIPKSWCDSSPEVTCGLHPHHISGVTIDSA